MMAAFNSPRKTEIAAGRREVSEGPQRGIKSSALP
jgi:hypothetical protein